MNEPKKKRSWGLVVLLVVVVLGGIGQLFGEDEGAPRSRVVPSSSPTAPLSRERAQPATPPTLPTTSPVAPTERQLAADEAFFKAAKKNPAADNYKRVGQQLKLSADEVLEAVSVVAEYRAALLEQARGAAKGAVGTMDIKEVTRTEVGAHTALVSFTATGCPEGDPRRDKDLELLATTALTKLAQQLPEPVDGYRAALWYRGLSCEPGSMGYGATWTRAGNKLTLE